MPTSCRPTGNFGSKDYDAYRSGANEVFGQGFETRIMDLFDKLIRLHGVG